MPSDDVIQQRRFAENLAEWIEALVERRVDEALAARALHRTHDRSPYGTPDEVATFIRTTRAQMDSLLAQGRLTRIKPGMPQTTPRQRWKNYPTLIAWDEVEDFVSGRPTGPVAQSASAARARDAA